MISRLKRFGFAAVFVSMFYTSAIMLGTKTTTNVIGARDLNRSVSSENTSSASSTDLYIRESFGAVEEHSLRVGTMAAHLYLDSTSDPYFFFAFPGENSGVSAWFGRSPGAHLEALNAPIKAKSISRLTQRFFRLKTLFWGA